MRFAARLLALWAFSFGFLLSIAGASDRGTILSDRLARAVAKSRIPPGSLGISVLELNGGSPAVVFDHRGSESMIPASNVKLLTTAALLDRLGRDFVLTTSIRVIGEIREGVLEGDVAVVGRGDPGISGRFDRDADPLATFRVWAEAFRARGIREVQGDLILDDLYFDRQFRAATWPEAGAHFWYQAPIAALSFEDNCIGIKVRPTRPGKPAQVTLVPETSLFSVTNRTKSVSTKHRKRSGFTARRERGSSSIVVDGKVAMGTTPEILFLTVDDPPAYFGGVLRELFQAEGISIRGGIRLAESSYEALGTEVARHETPLSLAVEVCNKRSQNFFAESFVKILGRERRGEGSWSAGLAEIADALVPLGLPAESYRLEDGSGISRGSRLTASQLTTLLANMRLHPLGDDYLSSLCAAGEDGCGFGRRLPGGEAGRANVMAKTGSIAGVRTLSGYTRCACGTLFAYSLLVNAPFPNETTVRRFQDAFLAELVHGGPMNLPSAPGGSGSESTDPLVGASPSR